MPVKLRTYCLPAIFAITAFALGLTHEVGCYFLQFSTTDDSQTDPTTVHFGLWFHQAYEVDRRLPRGPILLSETCHTYPDNVVVDTPWRGARAFSILSLTIGGIFIVLNLFACCLKYSKRKLRWSGAAYLFSCAFQGLSLLLLQSELCRNNPLMEEIEASLPQIQFQDTCSLGSGAKYSISSTVFWFVAAVSIFVPLPSKKLNSIIPHRDHLIDPLLDSDSDDCDEEGYISSARAREDILRRLESLEENSGNSDFYADYFYRHRMEKPELSKRDFATV